MFFVLNGEDEKLLFFEHQTVRQDFETILRESDFV